MLILVKCCGHAANACALLIEGVDIVSEARCNALSGDDDALAGIAVRSRCLACEHACNAKALGVKRHIMHTTCSNLRESSVCPAKLIKLVSQRVHADIGQASCVSMSSDACMRPHTKAMHLCVPCQAMRLRAAAVSEDCCHRSCCLLVAAPASRLHQGGRGQCSAS